jgi:hypothetical protein
MKASYVNYSSFGSIPSEEEKHAVHSILDDNIVLVTAAGNEGSGYLGYHHTGPSESSVQTGSVVVEKRGD